MHENNDDLVGITESGQDNACDWNINKGRYDQQQREEKKTRAEENQVV